MAFNLGNTQNLGVLKSVLDDIVGTGTQPAYSNNVHAVFLGHSAIAGWGSVDPDVTSFRALLATAFKRLGGDGGHYQMAGQARTLLDQSASQRFLVGRSLWYTPGNGDGQNSLFPTDGVSWQGFGGVGTAVLSTSGTLVRDTAYAVGYISGVLPTAQNGHLYDARFTVKTSGAEPTWPTTAAATVPDAGNSRLIFTEAGAPTGTETTWAVGLSLTVGSYVVPSAGNSHRYQVTPKTAVAQPAYPTTVGGTVADGGILITEAGIYPIPISTPPARFYDIVFTKTPATTLPYIGFPGGGTATFSSLGAAGFPAVVPSLSADAGSHFNCVQTIDAGIQARRTVGFASPPTGGAFVFEGIRTRPDGTNKGVIDYNCTQGGQRLDTFLSGGASVLPGLIGGDRTGLGVPLIPASDPSIFFIMNGANDYVNNVPLTTMQANVAKLIGGIKAAFPNAAVCWISMYPHGANVPAPTPASDQYNFEQGCGMAAVLAGAAWIDTSQMFGGFDVNTTVSLGLIDAVDTLHPTDFGYTVLYSGIMQALGIDLHTLAVGSDFNATQKASITASIASTVNTAIGVNTDGTLVSGGLADKVDDAAKAATHYSIDDKDYPTAITILKDDGTTKKVLALTDVGANGVKVGA